MLIDTIECEDCGMERIGGDCPCDPYPVERSASCDECGWVGDVFPTVGGSAFCPGCVGEWIREWTGARL